MNARQFSSIFVLIVLASIPILVNDVYGTIYGINIPEGAADINQKVHYLPTEVTVTMEDKVQWWNNDNTPHTVTSGSYQGGPDTLFNSGILEPNDFFIYQPTLNDIGTLSYYCTIHPWMNGFITVLDTEGQSVGRIAEAGSLEDAEEYVEEANVFVSNANGYVDLEYDNQAAVAFMQSAINFEKAAKEYALLDDNQNAAIYYHEAGMQHHNAALQSERAQDFTQAVVHHLHAGVQHHFAGVQYQMMGDHNSAGKHFAESIMHKGMAKYGSDYVLAPKHQVRWLADPADITCREGLELIQKSSTKEPVCVKPSSVEKLINRGYAVIP